MKKNKPNLDQMRDDLIKFEIEEVFYTKDYQALMEEIKEGWKSEKEIREYFKDEPSDYIEELWLETFNQYGDYNE